MVAEIELPELRFGEVTMRIAEDMESITVVGPAGFGERTRLVITPDELREFIRTDDRGRYRPLPGALTMRTNWEAEVRGELAAVAEALYPLAAEQQALAEDGELRIVGLDDVLSRQTGRYRPASELDQQGRDVAARVLCGQCVKQPLWRGEAWDEQSIPCPEACSVMVALCREAALWERERPSLEQPDPEVAYAAFEEPGNEIREVYLRVRYGEMDG